MYYISYNNTYIAKFNELQKYTFSFSLFFLFFFFFQKMMKKQHFAFFISLRITGKHGWNTSLFLLFLFFQIWSVVTRNFCEKPNELFTKTKFCTSFSIYFFKKTPQSRIYIVRMVKRAERTWTVSFFLFYSRTLSHYTRSFDASAHSYKIHL